MKKWFREKRDPYYMYLGNLLIFDGNIGKVSDVKYVVIRDRMILAWKIIYFLTTQ